MAITPIKVNYSIAQSYKKTKPVSFKKFYNEENIKIENEYGKYGQLVKSTKKVNGAIQEITEEVFDKKGQYKATIVTTYDDKKNEIKTKKTQENGKIRTLVYINGQLSKITECTNNLQRKIFYKNGRRVLETYQTIEGNKVTKEYYDNEQIKNVHEIKYMTNKKEDPENKYNQNLYYKDKYETFKEFDENGQLTNLIKISYETFKRYNPSNIDMIDEVLVTTTKKYDPKDMNNPSIKTEEEVLSTNLTKDAEIRAINEITIY